MGIVGQAPVVFDLRELALRDQIVKRWPHQRSMIAAVALLSLAGYFAALLVAYLGRTRQTSAVLGALALLTVLNSLLGAWAALRVPIELPGPESIRLDSAGLTCYFKDGHATFHAWHSKKLRLSLFDYSEDPQWAHEGLSYVLRLGPRGWGLGRHCPRTLLTREAAEGVLAMASTQHLQVASYQGSSAIYGASPRIHDIRSG